MLNRYEYISFDIFDTLIKRNVMNPKDIFICVQEKYNKNNPRLNDYVSQRIFIERNLRKCKKTEITLSEIYEQLALKYGNIIAEKLKELECRTEIDLCCANYDIKKIYEECINMGKKIIIITDMYLDRRTITKMLDKCGYNNYHKLYISSESGLTKESGLLYKFVRKDLNINKRNWIHIGDNKKSDFNKAIKEGISAKLINTIDNRLKYVNIKKSENFVESRINATLNNYSDDNFNYYERIGYESFGPIIIGFVNWLIKELEAEDIKKVYFLARDGYVIKKVYDIIQPKNIESKYLYVSRRSLQVPSFYINSDYESVLDSFFLPRKIKFEILIKKIGVTYEEISDIAEKYSFKRDSIIECKNIKSNKLFRNFYNEIKEYVIKNAKNEYLALVKYLKQNDFNNRVAIVDIGWFGNMQLALDKVIKHAAIDADIYGYYVGLVPEGNLQKVMNMKGYLFSATHNQDLHKKEKIFNSIFETFFLARHGSTKRYYIKNNISEVELYPYECKDKAMERNIQELQDSAIKLAKYWYEFEDGKEIIIEPRIAFANLCNICINPNMESAKKLGDLKFFDIEECYIAKPNSFKYYINRPKKFINDLNKAPWKVGFLKRTFKIKLPYYNIWMMARKIYKRYN